MKYMKTLTVGEQTYKIVDDNAVHFAEQTLTTEQQAQARANIGAVTVDDVISALPVYKGEVV